MPYVIAEIGFNHGGDMKKAEEMIVAAAHSGADAVKFQTFRASDISLPDSEHFGTIKDSELSEKEHQLLKKIADQHDVDFLSTPYSPWAVEMLEELGVPAYKVASMDLTNNQLLAVIAKTSKPIYLSSGMASLDEIQTSLDFLKDKKSGPVTLLHCLSLYPSTEKDINLNAIPFLKEFFNIPVGYSDHFPNKIACLVAAILGAEVIETHFTLDKNQPGGDHHHSADPTELKKIVENIALADTLTGDKKIFYDRPDKEFSEQFRRGVYASKELKAGQTLEEDDLIFVRPQTALKPNEALALIGKKINKDIKENQKIEKESVS